jgi:hypothetical protein
VWTRLAYMGIDHAPETPIYVRAPRELMLSADPDRIRQALGDPGRACQVSLLNCVLSFRAPSLRA